MAKVFREGDLIFSFGAPWTVLKYDDEPYYRDICKKLEGTKGVDFVGFHSGENAICFVEVKDFSSLSGSEARKRVGRDLHLSVAQKVRDTVAGICGAAHTNPTQADWRKLLRAMVDQDAERRIVLWIKRRPSVGPAPSNKRIWRKARKGTRKYDLKSMCSWFSKRVAMVDKGKRSPHLPDLSVKDA